MATVTVKDLPDDVHHALRMRAAQRGRSTEAEIRAILEASVRQPDRLPLGATLAALSRRADVTDEDVAALEQAFEQAPAKPMTFE